MKTMAPLSLPRTHGPIFWLGLIGATALLLGSFFGVRDILRGYLGAAIGLAMIPMGALGLLLMMDVMGGGWREVLRPSAVAIARVLPIAALVFVPILLGILVAPPWNCTPEPEWTTFRTIYLQPWFLVLRTILYFALWQFLLRTLLQSPARMVGFSAVGLIAFTITVSLAAVDWALSIERDFLSSIYGLLFIAHAVLAGLAATVILHSTAHRQKRPMLGALMITCLLLWAYMHAMQFIIIWAGDRPDEITWYMVRSSKIWLPFLWIISLGGFVLPFFLLLSAKTRASPQAMMRVSALILLMLLLECFWLTLPGHVGRVWAQAVGAIGGVAVCTSLALVAVLRLREGRVL